MNRKVHKNILGFSVLLLILSFFSLKSVYAETNSDACSSENLAKKYGSLEFDVQENLVKIDASKLDAKYKNVKFNLYKVGNAEVSPSVVVTRSEAKDVDLSKYNVTGDSVDLFFTIENDYQINSSDKNCSNSELSITVEGVNRRASYDAVDEHIYTASVIKTDAIDCNNIKSGDTFASAFCRIKNSNKTKKVDVSKSTSASFKCDYTKAYSSDNLKGDCYYKDENVGYLYGSKTSTINVGNYVYHLSPDTEVKEAVTCKRVCEEAVEVKYGPPVASKAGMCFEYKVKVVSRVTCSSESDVEKPKSYKVCTPYPYCYSGSWSGNQGGPNDEFDACIQSCDGGKYSKSCSNKCYKKVYGKNSGSSNDTFAMNLSNSASETALNNCANNNKNCKGNNCYGCYYRRNGSVYWYGLAKNIAIADRYGRLQYSSSYAPGKWYYDNSWGLTSEYHVYSQNGIYKAPNCSDSCSWRGCGSDTYLNKYNYDSDYEINKKIYESAVTQCQAMASCSESTAEFTIEADYSTSDKSGKTVVKTVKFPYSTEADKNVDTIKSTSKGWASDTKDNENTTFLEDGFDCKDAKTGESCTSCTMDKDGKCATDTTCDVLPANGFAGCYDKNTKKTDRYRATWSFPGTWINLKTGEISFKPISSSNTAWTKQSHKFCVPLDAEDVNTNWWNYYYYKITGKIPGLSSSDDGRITNCKTMYTDKVSESDIDWNIRAKTTKFGYFGWDITVNCFYALNAHSMKSTTTSETNSCVSNSSNYRVRSVDLNNLFPAQEGEGSREPGFNWSSFADTNNGLNNKNYLSTPSELVKIIQEKGNSVYSDEYLDYQFNITRDELRKMRNEVENSGSNYTNFKNSDFYIDSNGVGRYYSQKIRDNIKDKKVPEKSSNALKCNNMKNYSSSACENIVGEVK